VCKSNSINKQTLLSVDVVLWQREVHAHY
jgi:hypothetical protein